MSQLHSTDPIINDQPQASIPTAIILSLSFLSLFEMNSAIVALLFNYFSLKTSLSRKIYHEFMAISFFIFFQLVSKYNYNLTTAIMLGLVGGPMNTLHNLILLSSNHFKHLKSDFITVYIAHFLFKDNSIFNINNIYSEKFLSNKVDSRLRKAGDYRGFISSIVKPHLYISAIAGTIIPIIAYLGGVYCKKLSIMFGVALFGDGFGFLFPYFLRYLSGDKWIFHGLDSIGVKVLDGKKTLEGSFGVFLATFLLMLVIVDSGEYSSVMCVMIAGGYTCLEAFAPKDLDNPLLFLYCLVVFSVF